MRGAMLLSDLLSPKSILVPMRASGADAVIGALVDALELPAHSIDRAALRAAVLTREAAGSTGLGNGIAIPHARAEKLIAPRLAIGLAQPPIEFNAADGKPVSLFFLLAVPAANPTSHLKALAALSRLASDKALRRDMLRARTADELFKLLANVPV